jgi:uncharacterized protein YyaL (SSP411 family)
MNRLAKERSPYLRLAADQKIDWYPWCDEAFERAGSEAKPVFLSIGAAWCHWCHVMAKESFYNEAIAAILNERFICVKLDRDERPEIDRVYQQAVGAMVGSGGWPLSVFLTPDGKPFYGGSYFPPDDIGDRPGFGSILLRVADLYAENREEIGAYVAGLIDALKSDDTEPAGYHPALVEKAARAFVADMDAHNGGFGRAPKFPLTGAYEFMLGRCFLEGSDKACFFIRNTLTRMALGGIHDQLQGGFHRYSTDAEWIIPHFEKMADDNARLLMIYSDALSLFGDDLYRITLRGICRFLTEALADPDGGFFASQDADVTPDDEGGYFTWTENAIKTCVNRAEFGLLSRRFFHHRGVMAHDRRKHVLFAARPVPEIAAEMGISEAEAYALLLSGSRKLLEERAKREPPLLDRTLYSSLNGLVVSALLRASWVLTDAELAAKALKGLDRVINLRLTDGTLYHAEAVPAVLDDYIFLAEAAVSAYETTGLRAWLTRGIEITRLAVSRLWDKNSGGFFETESGVIGVKSKPVEDAPHPSPNAVAIRLLQRLYMITEYDMYSEMSEKALKAFFEKTSGLGLQWASYYCALYASEQALKLEIYDTADSELARAARSTYYPFKTLSYNREQRGYAVPCIGKACMNPLHSADELRDFISGLGRMKRN